MTNIRNANRIAKMHSWLAVLLLAALCFSLAVMRGGAADTPKSAGRLLVKVRAPLARSIEAALPLQTMELVAGQTGSAQIDQFLSCHSAHKARPLYPGIVRLKKQRGLPTFRLRPRPAKSTGTALRGCTQRFSLRKFRALTCSSWIHRPFRT
jgi:hypothetical protein